MITDKMKINFAISTQKSIQPFCTNEHFEITNKMCEIMYRIGITNKLQIKSVKSRLISIDHILKSKYRLIRGNGGCSKLVAQINRESC